MYHDDHADDSIRYLEAVKKQPAMAVLNHPAIKALAVVVFAAGQTFVLSSMWALGVTGQSSP